MKHLIFILCLSFSVQASMAATTVKLKINHFLNDNAFSFSQEATNNNDVKFNVKRLQYYISSISITHDDGQVTEASDVYILVNANSETLVDLGEYDITDVEAISFSIGVNQPENNEDPTQWPQDHALYPKSPSMHWGWSSGYRFVAMEGYSGASLNRKYEVHALGNMNYHKISIPTTASSENSDLIIELNADYAKALENIDVSFGPISHGFNNEAAELLRNFRDHVFSNASGEGNMLDITEVNTADISLYPNPSEGAVHIDFGSTMQATSVSVKNVQGQVISNTEVIGNELDIELAEAGLYFIEIYFEDNSRIVRKIINQ